jgi:N-acetylglucosamine-6-phosphate deacetylase
MTEPSEGEISGKHYATGEPIRLRWANGKITEMERMPADGNETSSTSTPNEAGDVWIAPGLFDAQVNGYAGVDFQRDDLKVGDLVSAARHLRNAGCTRFLLTLITDEWTKLTVRLRHLKELREQSAELQAAIAGWHIEGPFLSTEPGFHGAHDPALMCAQLPKAIRCC